jgi:hypothetical protein
VQVGHLTAMCFNPVVPVPAIFRRAEIAKWQKVVKDSRLKLD